MRLLLHAASTCGFSAELVVGVKACYLKRGACAEHQNEASPAELPGYDSFLVDKGAAPRLDKQQDNRLRPVVQPN